MLSAELLLEILAVLLGTSLLITIRKQRGSDLTDEFAHLRDAHTADFNAARTQMNESIDRSARSISEAIASATTLQADAAQRQQASNLESLKTWLEPKLDAFSREVRGLREDTEKQLAEMRKTVDEKLQESLERKITESFQTVNENLQAVFKGLGEMQTLAQGVGDLKKVLTNVKSRGGWGEVQLGRLLEDMLTIEQYDKNVKVKPGSNDTVEFAIKLPGLDEHRPVYLPLDAKFPHEDYERLQSAIESGMAAEIESAAKALEARCSQQARDISSKYIDPPHTTDFAIMYLPTEGLYAEIIRRPGLASKLQREFRVLITGPSTLMALLNSLQMGFRTLAIQQRSSEVWEILSKVKKGFEAYADTWERVDKQLRTVQNSVQDAARKSRTIGRSLKAVESSVVPEQGQVDVIDALLDFSDDDEVLDGETESDTDV